MYSKLLTRGGVVRATVALAGLVLVTACDSDHAVSPTAVQVPNGPQAAVIPTPVAFLATTYLDHLAKHLGGGVVLIRDSTMTPISLVADNGPMDYDKKWGDFSAKLPKPGTFNICFSVAPAGFALPQGSAPCIKYTVKGNTTAHVGPFVLKPAPSVSWRTVDGFAQPVGPSSFAIYIPRSATPIEVVDNGKNDLDPKLGSMLAKLPSAGNYSLCQTVAPANRYLANPACHAVDATSGGAMWGGFFFNYEKQVYNP